MPLQAVRERRRTNYVDPLIDVEPEELLKRLIEQVKLNPELAPATPQLTPGQHEQVIFELEIDGAQYSIVCRRLPPSVSPSPPASLSPRELMIARLIAKGLPNKNIGDLLEISPYTVATHLRRIFIKLDVSSRAAMVARLAEENLLNH